MGQVRAYSGDEEGLTALRDWLQRADAAMAARVKYYVGDVNDPAYLAEAMDGVDYVLYTPTIKSERECDEDPAEACTALLNPVNVVMQTAIEQKVQKLLYLVRHIQNRSLILVISLLLCWRKSLLPRDVIKMKRMIQLSVMLVPQMIMFLNR